MPWCCSSDEKAVSLAYRSLHPPGRSPQLVDLLGPSGFFHSIRTFWCDRSKHRHQRPSGQSVRLQVVIALSTTPTVIFDGFVELM